MSQLLTDLQKWYAAQCDEEWEHRFGIRIQTLDNPGWSVAIDLEGTLLESKAFDAVEQTEAENSWLVCKVENGKFIGAGDPSRLEQILGTFVNWAKSQPDWLSVPVLDEAAQEGHRDEWLWSRLGEEVGPETCQAEGCSHRRIAHSIFCKRHHFEQVRRKSCPFAGQAP